MATCPRERAHMYGHSRKMCAYADARGQVSGSVEPIRRRQRGYLHGEDHSGRFRARKHIINRCYYCKSVRCWGCRQVSATPQQSGRHHQGADQFRRPGVPAVRAARRRRLPAHRLAAVAIRPAQRLHRGERRLHRSRPRPGRTGAAHRAGRGQGEAVGGRHRLFDDGHRAFGADAGGTGWPPG